MYMLDFDFDMPLIGVSPQNKVILVKKNIVISIAVPVVFYVVAVARSLLHYSFLYTLARTPIQLE
jgi:hypothetical protein